MWWADADNISQKFNKGYLDKDSKLSLSKYFQTGFAIKYWLKCVVSQREEKESVNKNKNNN